MKKTILGIIFIFSCVVLFAQVLEPIRHTETSKLRIITENSHSFPPEIIILEEVSTIPVTGEIPKPNQENASKPGVGAIPAYRFFTADHSISGLNEILGRINWVCRDYFREVARDKLATDIIKDEGAFIDHLQRIGVLNTNPSLEPLGWEGVVDYAIYIGTVKQNNTVQIGQVLIYHITQGIMFRIPVLSDQPMLIAKDIALVMAELVSDKQQQKAFKKRINTYFPKSFCTRSIDLIYYGILYESEDFVLFPINVGMGFTLPINQSVGFSTRFSLLYRKNDYFDLTSGIGLVIRKVSSRVSPELSIMGGYTEKFLDKEHYGGPFMESGFGLGFYLTENFKVAAISSLQVLWVPTSGEFSISSFAGVKIGIGF